MNKIKSKLNDMWKIVKECENLPEWTAALIITAFAMFTMFYSDFQGTMDFAYQNAAKVYHGEFGGLKYMAANSYGMTLFAILLIWMLPFYPITCLIDTNYWYFGGLLAAVWSKLFLVVMTFFLIKGVVKTAEAMGIRKDLRKWIPLFMLTSMLYFIPVAEVGQCDIIETTFMVWGIYYYLKGDVKKFLLMFAIAIPMKYLPLMIFVPLVLLHQKNPLKIAAESICGGSLLGINLLIRKFVWGTFIGDFNSGAISGLVSNSVTDNIVTQAENSIVYIESDAVKTFFGSFISNSSIFFVVYILICAFAYSLNRKEDASKWAVYISALVYSCFLLFTDVNVYWFVIVLPFYTLIIFKNESQVRLGMLLEALFGVSMLFIFTNRLAWVVGGEKTFEYLFFRGMSSGADANTFFINELEIGGLLPIAYSSYVAGMLGLLLLNIPRLRREEPVENIKFDRWVIWIRIGIIAVWVALLVYLMLIR